MLEVNDFSEFFIRFGEGLLEERDLVLILVDLDTRRARLSADLIKLML